ncbi:MAG: hypothetical protein ACXAC6_01995, partial [Candidatus Hodarchaeales archaeon]
MVRRVWKFNLFLLILISFPLFLFVNIETKVDLELYNSTELFSADSSQKTINSIEKFSDILVLFRNSIPGLDDYEKFVVK